MSRIESAPQDYNSLRRKLLNARALFFDPDFPPSDKSLGNHPYDKRPEPIVWLRPHQISSRNPKEEDKIPEFIFDGVNQHDVYQGDIGNCWFIAGASALALSHPAEFQRVVPPDQSFDPQTYTGMFRFNFWWFGTWTQVIVDDYLPTHHGKLIYCHNVGKPNEFWPCLLEKAYAKLYGSYQVLVSGFIHDALVDLTGGISEEINIQDRSHGSISSDLYNLLYTAYKMGTLMGAMMIKQDNSKQYEERRPDGLYRGHGYSITGFRTVTTGRDTNYLVRLRNPWGQTEWTGAWSDRSPEMAKLSRDVKIDLRFINKDDGEFWMSYDDFKNTFDVIRLCHLQPDSLIQELKDNNRKQTWNVTVYHDAWIKGVTAGGRRNHVQEKFYWINPQFYITLDTVHPTLGHGHGCTLIVSLMKKDKQRRLNIAIDFHVYKLKSPNSWQLDKTTQPESALLVSEGYSVHREVTKRFSLSPGTYIIIPSTYRPDEEGEFILTVFTEKKEDIGVQEKVAFIPTKPVVKDQLLDLFNKHAGSDQRMNAGELCTFLEEVSTLELRERLSFSIESCRSLVSFLDEDISGYLSFNEAKRAWKEIKVYRVFQ